MCVCIFEWKIGRVSQCENDFYLLVLKLDFEEGDKGVSLHLFFFFFFKNEEETMFQHSPLLQFKLINKHFSMEANLNYLCFMNFYYLVLVWFGYPISF